MNKIRCADLLVEYGASFDRLQALDLLDELYQEMVSDNLLIKIMRNLISIGNKCLTLLSTYD